MKFLIHLQKNSRIRSFTEKGEETYISLYEID
jgi:hypothetical protein